MNGYSVKGFRDLPTFREMPRRRIAAIGLGLTMALVLAGLFYDKIPTFGGTDSHQAYFAEIGGLRPGDKVQISGVDVGKVSSIKLAGNKVRVSFTVDSPVPLGSGTRAAIVTTSVLGKRGLRLQPRGAGRLGSDPIPLERTTAPYSLTDALDDAGSTLGKADAADIDGALRSLNDVLDEAAPELGPALRGVGDLSKTIGDRDKQLRTLLTRSRGVTSILSDRSKQLNQLLLDGAYLMRELAGRRDELTRLIIGVRSLAQQISATIRGNKAQITPALTKLQSVLTVLEDQKTAISQAIPGLRNFSMSLGESVATGPFFTAFTANLVPVIYFQPLVDALVADADRKGGR